MERRQMINSRIWGWMKKSFKRGHSYITLLTA